MANRACQLWAAAVLAAAVQAGVLVVFVHRWTSNGTDLQQAGAVLTAQTGLLVLEVGVTDSRV
jgi:chitinase